MSVQAGRPNGQTATNLTGVALVLTAITNCSSMDAHTVYRGTFALGEQSMLL